MNATPENPPLLGPGDPPPVETVNPDGPAPLVLLCDHASNAVPAALANLGLPPSELSRHIAWDPGAGRVTRLLADRFGAAAVLGGYSRLVIDCNRRPGHETSIALESDGTIVPGNLHLTAGQVTQRVDAVFRPYHEAAARLVEERLTDGGGPAVIAVHSFTAKMGGVPRPWHVSVLWGQDPRIAVPLIARLREDGSLVVGDNEPYSGRQHYGYSIETHASARGLPSALIEIREDQLRDGGGHRRWARILGAALEPILGDPALYRVRHYG